MEEATEVQGSTTTGASLQVQLSLCINVEERTEGKNSLLIHAWTRS